MFAMSNQKAPPRRNTDVIQCPNCGEEYSVTYKRCPFCDERADGRLHTAPGSRRSGGGQPLNPLQIFGLVISLALIVAALIIVFKTVSPMLFGSSSDGGSSTSTSQQQGDNSQTENVAVEQLLISQDSAALKAGEEWQAVVTTQPTGATTPITWSSSDSTVATVDQFGNIRNVYTGTGEAQAVITASAGDKSVTCTVTCTGDGTGSSTSGGTTGGNTTGGGTTGGSTTGGSTTGGSTSGGIAPNTDAVIVGATGGLNIRSGPGTTYTVQASTTNGATVTVLEEAADGWYKIKYAIGGGEYAEGYVMGTYLSPADT